MLTKYLPVVAALTIDISINATQVNAFITSIMIIQSNCSQGLVEQARVNRKWSAEQNAFNMSLLPRLLLGILTS